MRGDIYGMRCKKIVTSSGKRTILISHKTEVVIVQKMFRLRAEGRFTDQEIIEQMNTMGSRRIPNIYEIKPIPQESPESVAVSR